jgi:hypothetical protein
MCRSQTLSGDRGPFIINVRPFSAQNLAFFLLPVPHMASFRLKILVGSLLGLVCVILATSLLLRASRDPRPAAVPPPVAVPEPATPAPIPEPAPRPSRSRGLSEWAFFFRPGDTLSRMADGAPLGVVVRLERSHSFPDGSAGPAYVVRSAAQQEAAFDADELERSARIEAIREIARPPVGTRPR